MDIFAQLLANGLITGALYALMALGFTLVYGVTKFFNLAHGVFPVVAGYLAFFFISSLGWNMWAAGFLGVLGAGISGLLMEKLVYLPLRRKKASPMVLLVASIGVFTFLPALVAILFTSRFQSFVSLVGISPSFEIAGAVITGTQLFLLALSGMLAALSFVLISKTSFGKATRAICDDEEAAKIVGIDTNRIIAQTFFLGGALGGVAGVFTGLDLGLEPGMGLGLLVEGVVAAIIGGIGSLPGAVLGAFLLSYVETFGVWAISSEWRFPLAFGLLIIFLLFRPRGIIKE